MSRSRRDFLKVSATGVAVLSQTAYRFGLPAAPKGRDSGTHTWSNASPLPTQAIALFIPVTGKPSIIQ
jgi:hypothetical protein